MQTPKVEAPEWVKYVFYALIIPALGFVWVWILKPSLVKITWYLIEQDPVRKAEFFISVLEDAKHQPRLKKVSIDIFGDRIKHVDDEIERAIAIGQEALDMAHANRDTGEFLRSSVLQQGSEIARIAEQVGGIPQLSLAVQRVKDAVGTLEKTANDSAVLLARIEERQIAIAQMVDRRTHQIDPHPNQRSTDGG